MSGRRHVTMYFASAPARPIDPSGLHNLPHDGCPTAHMTHTHTSCIPCASLRPQLLSPSQHRGRLDNSRTHWAGWCNTACLCADSRRDPPFRCCSSPSGRCDVSTCMRWKGAALGERPRDVPNGTPFTRLPSNRHARLPVSLAVWRPGGLAACVRAARPTSCSSTLAKLRFELAKRFQ